MIPKFYILRFSKSYADVSKHYVYYGFPVRPVADAGIYDDWVFFACLIAAGGKMIVWKSCGEETPRRLLFNSDALSARAKEQAMERATEKVAEQATKQNATAEQERGEMILHGHKAGVRDYFP